MTRQQRWQDLSNRQKTLVILAGMVQFLLLGAALRDIRRRPAEQINGSKRVWTLAAFVNYIGPISYFVFGRKRE